MLLPEFEGFKELYRKKYLSTAVSREEGPRSISDVISLLEASVISGECGGHYLTLEPLTFDEFGMIEFNVISLFQKGWNDQGLRRDYLFSLPSSYGDIKDKLTEWIRNPEKLTYLYGIYNVLNVSFKGIEYDIDIENIGNIGYISFDFTEDLDKNLIIIPTYGNLCPEKQGLGFTKTAFTGVLYWLIRECKRLGFPIKEAQVYVNDENTPSLEILRANGFIKDEKKGKISATAVRGGLSGFYINYLPVNTLITSDNVRKPTSALTPRGGKRTPLVKEIHLQDMFPYEQDY